jgi:hypothetical protein
LECKWNEDFYRRSGQLGSTKTSQDEDDAEKNARNELHDRKYGGTNYGQQSRHA